MSRALVTLLTVGALLAGGGVAFAAWTSSGPGTVTARAGTLAAPTATASAWSCGASAAAPRFADGGRAVEAFPAAAPTTTATAAPLAATTTPVPTTTAATTTTTVPPTTSGPAAAPAATTTTTTVAPTTTSTSGVVTGLGAAGTTLSWTATGAASYQYQAATTADFAGPVAAGATGATSATVTVRAVLATTVYLRVRGVVGAWNGPWSATLTTRAGPCLL